LPGSPLVLEQ